MPDPFGLKAGSTPPAGMANYMISFHAVPKPHPGFTHYSGTWMPDVGLTRVLASSATVNNEADCSSSRAIYERVKRQLSQVYGEPTDLEFIDDHAAWSDECDFWNSLNAGERSHSSSWSSGNGNRLDAGIEQIDLMIASGTDYESSYVLLSYQFHGFETVEPADEYGLESL